MKGRSFCALVVVLALAAGAQARDTDRADVCHLENAPRVVAVGDVHGAYAKLIAVLRMVGLVDEDNRWSGGTTVFVQTGDVTDRGKDTRKVLDLLMRLEGEARDAGGRVVALLGNHEVMNILGDLRSVNPEEHVAFRTAESGEVRERFIEVVMERARQQARARGEHFDSRGYRAKLEEEAPLGFVERQQAFSEEGLYGRWLRDRPVLARIDGALFLHGGLTPEVAALGCDTINETVRKELTSAVDETRRAPLESLAARVDGPLWYRGLAQEDEASFAPAVERVLSALEARVVVVGHTVTADGRIRTRFGGRVVQIDVGMAPYYHGSLAALEMDNEGTLVAVYPGGREVLEVEAPAAAAERTAPALPTSAAVIR